MLRLILFLSLICIQFAHGDLFLSTEELKGLTDDHRMFVQEVSKLIESLEMNVDYLKW